MCVPAGIFNSITVQPAASVQRGQLYKERAAYMFGVLPWTLAQVPTCSWPLHARARGCHLITALPGSIPVGLTCAGGAPTWHSEAAE